MGLGELKNEKGRGTQEGSLQLGKSDLDTLVQSWQGYTMVVGKAAVCIDVLIV
jgi:hypothetical protein